MIGSYSLANINFLVVLVKNKITKYSVKCSQKKHNPIFKYGISFLGLSLSLYDELGINL